MDRSDIGYSLMDFCRQVVESGRESSGEVKRMRFSPSRQRSAMGKQHNERRTPCKSQD